MKPAPFEYHAPPSLAEAVQLLADAGDDAKIIAGGQSLVPMLNLRLTRFDALIDLGRIPELRTMERSNGSFTVGAMVTEAEVELDPVVADAVPLLARATPLIGHFQIRNRGTVGGSIAHADPAAEYPAVALALDAELVATGPNGSRTIPASELFVGTWMTTLEPDEILTAVRFPVWEGSSGFAVEEVARRHGDFAIAGATVGVTVAEGVVRRAAVALFGMGATPVRASAAEAALLDGATDPREIGRLAVEGLEPPDDLHASSALRSRIGATTVARAVERALEEARA